MKKFLIKILLFLFLAWAYDFAVGEALQYLADHARSGMTRKNLEIADTVSPDILVLGSSRAFYHYVPSILEDSLGGTAYVAGEKASGIIMMNPLLHYIAARHKPDIVIYDLTPLYDFSNDDSHRYIKSARPLWGRNSYMDSVICLVDPTERFKLRSRLFRFNSMPLGLLRDNIKRTGYLDKGYLPLHGRMNSGTQKNGLVSGQFEISRLKVSLLKELIVFCRENDIQLYFVVSPYYDYSVDNFTMYVAEIEKFGGKIMNFGSYAPLIRPDYFNDPLHLNHTGACIYTDTLTSHIRRLQQDPPRR